LNLIEFKSFSEQKNAEVELLYGTTGYLYTLLFLKKFILSMEKVNDIKNIVTKDIDKKT
jgi:hypothetical protein